MTWLFPLLGIPTPSLRELIDVLGSVVDWYVLGLHLGLRSQQLKQIEVENRGEISRCKVEMLDCWLQTDFNPTWKAITDALSRMGEHIAAMEIEKKYCSSSSVTGM